MSVMKLKTRDIVLLFVTVCSIVFVMSLPRTGQNPSFHIFADQREILGLPNFYNVITNLPFVVIGFIGLLFFVNKERAHTHKLASIVLFTGIICIGAGSAWYHYYPTNASLVWDRIPMTITFMSYFSIVVGDYVNKRLGSFILWPLLIVGVFSIYYWYMTEQAGAGDLRLYAWVQFFPMICIPLIMFLYPSSRSVKVKIISIILVYALAKVAEQADEVIFNFHRIISGHSVKHLFASFAVLLILFTLKEDQFKV
jgi:hypothetical protein